MSAEWITDPESGEPVPALYAQYLKDPEKFEVGIARQIEMYVSVECGYAVRDTDQKDLRAVAHDVCFNSFWLFPFGLHALIDCAGMRFMKRVEVRRVMGANGR